MISDASDKLTLFADLIKCVLAAGDSSDVLNTLFVLVPRIKGLQYRTTRKLAACGGGGCQ